MTIDQNLLRIVASTTQDECREMGKMLLELADRPRDVQWKAMFRDQLAAMETPETSDRARVIEWARASRTLEQQMLDDEHLSHEALMNAELDRRGESRRFRSVISGIEAEVAVKIGPRPGHSK